ncbi:MAG: hypothetical protein CV089_05245 [Nitrospira sp. WS110]|nr:hypothetical protein [Nitrospira sp. WS110]
MLLGEVIGMVMVKLFLDEEPGVLAILHVDMFGCFLYCGPAQNLSIPFSPIDVSEAGLNLCRHRQQPTG